VGTCDFCRADDHLFVMEIDEMTEISIRGKITMYADGEMEHSTEFTARGYWDDNGTYYEAQMASPWEETGAILRTFSMTYDRETDKLSFYGMWYNAQLQREKT